MPYFLELLLPGDLTVSRLSDSGFLFSLQFHSHQLFHIFVVAGAFVHFHGVSNLQEFRFMIGGGCTEEDAL